MPLKHKCPRRQKNALFAAKKSPKEKTKLCSVRANAKNGPIPIVLEFQLFSSKTYQRPLLRFSVLRVTSSLMGSYLRN